MLFMACCSSLAMASNPALAVILPANEPDYSIWTMLQDYGLDRVHPTFVHYPIALGLFGVLLYYITYFFKKNDACWKFFSFFVLFFAEIAALCTLGTGAMYSYGLNGNAHVATNWHQNMAILTVLLFGVPVLVQILSYIFKKDLWYLKTFCLVLYTLGALSVATTGFIGGSIVYDYLINPTVISGS